MDVEHMNKDELRRAIRRRRTELSCGEEGAARSRRMQERLLADELWRRCRRVALFVSVKGEPDTSLLLDEAWRSGRTVFLPRCRKGEKGVICLLYTSPSPRD